jgi:hypothetical protein
MADDAHPLDDLADLAQTLAPGEDIVEALDALYARAEGSGLSPFQWFRSRQRWHLCATDAPDRGAWVLGRRSWRRR